MQEYDEISLKELILAILKGWKIVFASLAIAVLGAFILLFGVNTTTHVVELDGIIRFQTSYQTSLGAYTPTLTTQEEVLNQLFEYEFMISFIEQNSNKFPEMELNVQSIRDIISLEFQNKNDFTIKIANSNQELVNILTSFIQSNLETYLRYKFQYSAINTLKESYINANTSIERTVVRNQELLKYYLEKLETTDAVLAPNAQMPILNPTYELYSLEVAKIQSSQSELEFSFKRNQQYLLDLDRLYIKNNTFNNFKKSNEWLDNVDLNFTLFNYISTYQKKQFATMLTLAISVVLGLMMGVFLALFISYWKSEDIKNP